MQLTQPAQSQQTTLPRYTWQRVWNGYSVVLFESGERARLSPFRGTVPLRMYNDQGRWILTAVGPRTCAEGADERGLWRREAR